MSQVTLTAARVAASVGYVLSGLIPFLAAPNTDIIQYHRLDPALSASKPQTISMHIGLPTWHARLRNLFVMHSNYIKPFCKPTLWSNPTFLRVRPHQRHRSTHANPLLPNRPIAARDPNPASRPFIPLHYWRSLSTISLSPCTQLSHSI